MDDDAVHHRRVAGPGAVAPIGNEDVDGEHVPERTAYAVQTSDERAPGLRTPNSD
jgi:hypothetical protein